LNIKIIGSGSSGNCYRVSDGKTSLLLEAGLPIKKIKQGCKFNLCEISGCLITHEHGDHAKSAKEIMQCGVNIYTSRGTAETLGIVDSYRCNCIELMHYTKIGTFQVLPFEVHHDAAEPVGYLINSTATKERLLFMTDTYYTQFTFSGLTHIMIEANFSEEALSDSDNDPRRRRLRHSHMSIENCTELLKANDLSSCREIWLIHLSSSNGDAEGFKRRVQEATGCEVHVA
jgi:phosphoribosyl 1,2-cyclic phosphodiesterase